MTLLNDAEWATWSDREIARRCAVSNQFVSNLRPSVNDGQIDRKVERNGSTYTMNTAAIGKPKEDEMYAEDRTVITGEGESPENCFFKGFALPHGCGQSRTLTDICGHALTY